MKRAFFKMLNSCIFTFCNTLSWFLPLVLWNSIKGTKCFNSLPEMKPGPGRYPFCCSCSIVTVIIFQVPEWDKFVARKAKYLSLAWLFTDTSLVYPLRWRSKTSLLILYISWHFQNLGTNMLLLCPAQTFSWFLLLTTVLFTQWWLRTKNYKRGQRICFPAF